jgi:hypothetical protein
MVMIMVRASTARALERERDGRLDREALDVERFLSSH